MKVFVEPIGLHSRAMNRIARALKAHAPAQVQFAMTPFSADLVVMYVIGLDAMQFGKDLLARGKQYVAMQCCLGGVHELATGENIQRATDWDGFWRDAALVWSYYDLRQHAKGKGFSFYHSPLGADPVFAGPWQPAEQERHYKIMTSGYVSGPGAEPIEDCWKALAMVGAHASSPVPRGIHIGPERVAGMQEQPAGWEAREGVSDRELARIYRDTEWVAALRRVEGFEMPAVEALACGARPICFDRPDMRQWYDGHAVFIPEDDNTAEHVAKVLEHPADPVTEEERQWALSTFGWERIIHGFWGRLLEEAQERLDMEVAL